MGCCTNYTQICFLPPSFPLAKVYLIQQNCYAHFLDTINSFFHYANMLDYDAVLPQDDVSQQLYYLIDLQHQHWYVLHLLATVIT
jgi:hypothetical protein